MKTNYLNVSKCSYASPEGKSYRREIRRARTIRFTVMLILSCLIGACSLIGCSTSKTACKTKHGTVKPLNCFKKDKYRAQMLIF